MQWYKWLMNTKFFRWGFNENWAIWFHMLFGGIGAKISDAIGYSCIKTMIIILGLAIGWEVIEFLWDGGIKGMIKIYGSLERWIYDCLGDIIMAVIIAWLVIY